MKEDGVVVGEMVVEKKNEIHLGLQNEMSMSSLFHAVVVRVLGEDQMVVVVSFLKNDGGVEEGGDDDSCYF